MKESWAPLPDFPHYSVSDHGRIRNDVTDRIMALTLNNRGIVQVGMIDDDGIYRKRGVALLVAKAFVEPASDAFDTPINLNGDRTDNYAGNLEWRPRFFAYQYHAQFKNHYRSSIKTPIWDIKTGERFESTLDACMRYGLLERDLVLAIQNMTYVWPTYQIFEAIIE